MASLHMDSITNVTASLLSWAIPLIECTVLWYFKALKHIFSKLPLCISSVVHSLSHWLQARFQVWYHAYIYMHSMYFVSCVQRRWKYIDCSWYSHICGFVVCCFRFFFSLLFPKGCCYVQTWVFKKSPLPGNCNSFICFQDIAEHSQELPLCSPN